MSGIGGTNMYCRHCGKEVNEEAIYCMNCGKKPLTGHEHCHSCGTDTTDGQEICIKCGVNLKKPQMPSKSTKSEKHSHCRHCGNSINEHAEICVKCGKEPTTGYAFCQKCGTDTTDDQVVCINCGVHLNNTKSTQSEDDPFDSEQYYEEEFAKIRASNGEYKGKWNWAAFFFGALWGFTKGLWQISLIMIAITLIFSASVVIPIAIWIFYGVRGNYLYYRLVEHGEQLPSFSDVF